MTDNEKVLFDEIEKACRKVLNKQINSFLSDKVFNLSDCDFMINYLTDRILNDLNNISDNFKYIINLILLQNDSNGFTQNMAFYYDIDTDGCVTEKYSFNDIQCVANVFCLSI
jgi:hypothetical protein